MARRHPQLAERFATQVVAQSDLSTRQATLNRLRRRRRDALEFTETSEDVVKTAEATVAITTEQATAERGRGGRRDLCRQREEESATRAQRCCWRSRTAPQPSRPRISTPRSRL
jgi:hypothetical protein